MNEIKIRYVLKNKITGEIHYKKYYKEIQDDIRNGVTKAQSIDFYIEKERK